MKDVKILELDARHDREQLDQSASAAEAEMTKQKAAAEEKLFESRSLGSQLESELERGNSKALATAWQTDIAWDQRVAKLLESAKADQREIQRAWSLSYVALAAIFCCGAWGAWALWRGSGREFKERKQFSQDLVFRALFFEHEGLRAMSRSN